jgi:hypothetical protein
LLRAPFSLQKIHWNPATKTVIYRSRRSWNTKRNFEVFPATDFLAAARLGYPGYCYSHASDHTRTSTRPQLMLGSRRCNL